MVCKTCGNALEWYGLTYCSKACANKGLLKRPVEVICAGCSKAFNRNTRFGGKPKYCSFKCYNANRDVTRRPDHNPNRHSNEEKKCECGCGTLIRRYDNRGREKKYAIGHVANGKPRPDLVEVMKGNRIDLELQRGENHWNWKGGISSNEYPDEWNNELKKSILSRDGYKCSVCGRNHQLCVHHKDENKKNCMEHNLVTMCRSCHASLHVGNLDEIKDLLCLR